MDLTKLHTGTTQKNSAENVIGQYQACINEFEKLGYDDAYLQEIKAEMLKLQTSLSVEQ